MRVYIEKEDKEYEVSFCGKLSDLLEKIHINSQTIVATRNDELLTLEDNIEKNDTIKLLSVISGG